jgi:hypothetical protein
MITLTMTAVNTSETSVDFYETTRCNPGDRGSIPGGGKEESSSSLCVQTGSGSHSASCPVGTGGPFPGGKARPGRDADHSHPSSALVVNK